MRTAFVPDLGPFEATFAEAETPSQKQKQLNAAFTYHLAFGDPGTARRLLTEGRDGLKAYVPGDALRIALARGIKAADEIKELQEGLPDDVRNHDLAAAIHNGHVDAVTAELKRYPGGHRLLAPGLANPLLVDASMQKSLVIVQGLIDHGAEIDRFHLPALDASLTEMMSIQGACERIKSTPIPFSFTVLMHRIVLVYCTALPFGIVGQVHMMTPFVVLLVAYAFYGLDAIGEEIEDPFGLDPNDLPLNQLSTMIEINLREALREQAIPDAVKPTNYIVT